MRKKIFFTGIEKRPGKSFVSLGLFSALKNQQTALRGFKLFSELDTEQAALFELVAGHPIHEIMDINQAISLMQTQPDELIDQVMKATDTSEDVPLRYFEGSDFESDNDVFEYQFNLTLAYQLNCEVILTVSAKDRTLEHTLSVLNTALEMAKKNHANVVGVVINRISEQYEAEAPSFFKKKFKNLPLVVVLPEFKALANPTMQDIAKKLDAEVFCGSEELMRPVKQFTIAAKYIENFLASRIDRAGMLIITPGDRIDILLGSLLADSSANYPKIAGIVLSGGDRPAQAIHDIIAGLEHPFPVLIAPLQTYEVATTLYSAKFSLSRLDMNKVHTALEAIRPYLEEPLLGWFSQKSDKTVFSPAMFLYDIAHRAKAIKRHIVLPEGDDPRILQAADYLLKRNIVDITLLGEAKKIQLLSKRLELKLPGVTIIDIETAPKKRAYAEQYLELRKHKNINLPIALERVTDGNYFGAMMVYCGDADGMVSGAAHTTADTVRPALEIIKTKAGISRASSIFIMCLATKVLIYGDCAINPEPDSDMLAEIATQAAEITLKLGLAPKVALLSYSSGSSGSGASVEKVMRAYKTLKQNQPNMLVEGPIQYDAAVDSSVAAKKLPNSKVAGEANVLIFPDLNTGNNTYKAVQRESGAIAVGPILLGLNKPVNDLSRGCTPQDIINTILITAIQAQGDKS